MTEKRRGDAIASYTLTWDKNISRNSSVWRWFGGGGAGSIVVGYQRKLLEWKISQRKEFLQERRSNLNLFQCKSIHQLYVDVEIKYSRKQNWRRIIMLTYTYLFMCLV